MNPTFSFRSIHLINFISLFSLFAWFLYGFLGISFPFVVFPRQDFVSSESSFYDLNELCPSTCFYLALLIYLPDRSSVAIFIRPTLRSWSNSRGGISGLMQIIGFLISRVQIELNFLNYICNGSIHERFVNYWN